MTTALLELDSVIEVEPELKKKADAVLNELGLSVKGAVDLFLRNVTSRKKLPEELKRPPIPCLEDLTEEEFDALMEEAFDDIEAGRTYTIEEVRKFMEEQYAKF